MSLAAFVLRRILWAIPVLLLVMLLTFALMRGAGGTPFEPPEGVPGLPAPLQRELTDFYNLDEPWFVEFATYVGNVATLDFGPSLVNRYRSVDDAVEEGFPVTLELPPGQFLSGSPSGCSRRCAAARSSTTSPRPPPACFSSSRSSS